MTLFEAANPSSIRSRLAACVACILALIAIAIKPCSAQGADASQQIADLGQCKLESGLVIENCRVGYRTFGQLSSSRDNAVLMPTWLYGRSADLAPLFGEGDASPHLVDTRRYFGIAIDALGNGVSSSPSNSRAQHGPSFPQFTVRDMVATQYRVVTEVLGLHHLHAVIGLSMGGEQTFVWAVTHPDFFDRAVPILGTPRLTVYDLQVKRIMIDTILADPAYNNGNYVEEPPLKLANLVGNLVVTSPEFRNQATPLNMLNQFFEQAESPLPIDANDRLSQLRAIITQDVIGNRSLSEVAHAVHPKFLVVVSAEDRLVNPQPALDWAAASQAEVYVSHGSCAHLIMTCDAEQVSKRVRAFLAAAPLR